MKIEVIETQRLSEPAVLFQVKTGAHMTLLLIINMN